MTKNDYGYEEIRLLCSCGYNFREDADINWNEKIDYTIICPKCHKEYRVKYDAYPDKDDSVSQKWWLEKKG